MTSAGRHTALFDNLPSDVASLVQVVQGLLLHEHWASRYGVDLSDERRSESHIRPAATMLDCLLTHDARPLTAGRSLDAKTIGTCRNFTVLLVAILRAQGTPARARCGFGAYFTPGTFEDHWVCEYWNTTDARWVLVDAQIDAFQYEQLNIDFDLLDVPRDRFIVAGDSWTSCRAGKADPTTFGIFKMSGLWFIAGNLMRDLAALNNMEMLPWDDWGNMAHPDEPLLEEQVTLFDQVAAVTRNPDSTFPELRELYADGRLRVPPTVHNAVLNRLETL